MLDMGCQPGMRNRVGRHLHIGQHGVELDDVNAFWCISTHGTTAVGTGFYSGSGIGQG